MIRAAAAAALGVAFLAGSTPGYAAWQQAHSARDLQQQPTGLDLVAGQRRLLLTRSYAQKPVDISANPAAYRFVVGDSLTVELPVTLYVGQDMPQAVLAVQVPKASGDSRLAEEFAATANTLEIRPTQGAPALAAVTGNTMARKVTPAAHGHTYLVRWSTRTRPTRDGKTPRTGDAANLWGSGAPALQGVAVGARPMTITLAPEATP